MSRHRSPQGRRAHLGPPLFAFAATAGVGAARSLPQQFALPMRFAATVVAGGALAAAGQQALVAALPAATDGANVLRLGVQELLGAPTAAAAPAEVAPRAFDPVVPAAAPPAVADAAGLVKSAGLREAAEKARVEQAEAPAAAAPRTATAVAPRTAASAAPTSRAAAPTSRAAAPTTAARPTAAAAAAATGGVQMLVGRVTSNFGARGGTTHKGLDIAAPIGTPIRAPLGGTVISSGPASGFGLWVRLQHADGTITVYGHINRALVSVGQKVAAGQLIAEVGNRGQSTGPHLHIEVKVDGATINPRTWLDQRGVRYT